MILISGVLFVSREFFEDSLFFAHKKKAVRTNGLFEFTNFLLIEHPPIGKDGVVVEVNASGFVEIGTAAIIIC